MFLSVLKRFAIAFFLFAFASNVLAQQTHFVYLQTENGQSFYVKINNKVISSSPAGYLILPKLTDGDYKVSVGFPKKEFPEENFQIVVDKMSAGFLLKNFGEKGWGLFNMQSYAVTLGGSSNATVNSAKNLDDPFSKLLANVVRDSSILQKNEPVKIEPPPSAKVDSAVSVKEQPVPLKTDSVTVIPGKTIPVKVDSIIANAGTDVPKKIDSGVSVAEKPAPLLLSPATRLLSKKSKNGVEMIYVDHNQDVNDTIRIFIPSRKAAVKPNVIDSITSQNTRPTNNPPFDSTVINAAAASNTMPATTPAADSGRVAVTSNEVTQNNKAAARELPDSAAPTSEQPATNVVKAPSVFDTAAKAENGGENRDTLLSKKPVEVTTPAVKSQERKTQPLQDRETAKKEGESKDDIVVLPRVVQSSAINSDCKGFASNEDFLRLRKKMAAETSDDNMLKIAKKAFHLKCFSTEQIRNISFLFLTNSGKYTFFDTAYPYASDSELYSSLESQLTDSYYINRFKAMIHK